MTGSTLSWAADTGVEGEPDIKSCDGFATAIEATPRGLEGGVTVYANTSLALA